VWQKEGIIMESITIQITNLLVYDKLNMLAVELTLSQSRLINLAVERLIDDVEFVRELRELNEKLQQRGNQ
jgi:hypothetical protein